MLFFLGEKSMLLVQKIVFKSNKYGQTLKWTGILYYAVFEVFTSLKALQRL